MLEKLKELALRYEDLQAQLADPSVYGGADRLRTVNRELKELAPVAETYQAYQKAEADSAAAEAMLSDPELREVAQEELERFAGRPLPDWASVLDAARGLLDRGIGTVVVSRGGDGALLCRRDGVWKAPGLSVPVGSTVGAGDSMVAALAYGQETGMDWPDRLRLAVAVSAASVMCRGTQGPEHDTIARLYRQVTIVEV